MRAGVICRYAMSAVAAAATMALVVSTVPAAAQAVASRSNETSATQRLLPAQTFRPESGQSLRAPSGTATSPFPKICLYNASQVCMGPDDNSKKIIISISLQIIWNINENDTDTDEGAPPETTPPGEKQCLAAQGLDQQLTQLPCTSTQGIYWKYQFVVGEGFRMWNTEFHCWLTAHADTSGTWAQCSTLTQEPWSVWTLVPS